MSSARKVVDQEGSTVVTVAPYKVAPLNPRVLEELSSINTSSKKVSDFKNV